MTYTQKLSAARNQLQTN